MFQSRAEEYWENFPRRILRNLAEYWENFCRLEPDRKLNTMISGILDADDKKKKQAQYSIQKEHFYGILPQ